MITLEEKPRNDSKIVKFLFKYAPDTFESKYAKLLDSIIKNSIFKYQNYDSSKMWPEEFAAKCISYEDLKKKNPLLSKLEEYYFRNDTNHSLLSFYNEEIKDLSRIRDVAANSVGLRFILETFNLSNQAVSNRINEYQFTIDSFIQNYYAITNYKKIQLNNGHNTLVLNHIQNFNTYHTIS